jgi:hypothetical protein
MTNKVEQLIAIVKEYPIIYNMTLPDSGAELNLKWSDKLVKNYQTPTHPKSKN